MNFNKNTIIETIKKNGKIHFIQLTKILRVERSSNREFSAFLRKLQQEDLIYLDKKNDLYSVPKLLMTVESDIIIPNDKTFGFVNFVLNTEENEERAIVFNNKLNSSLNGDKVLANVFEDPNMQGKYYASVVKIISRKNKYLYGKISKKSQEFTFEPINFRQKVNFIFDHKLEETNNNIYAKVEIVSIDKNNITIKLISKIGNIEQPYSDIELIIQESEIDYIFNDEVIKETKEVPHEVIDVNQDSRKDLTNLLIVTIDGKKTKDFDDAIRVIKNSESGNYILSVYIADVAHYVKEDSAIDKQAYNRGTSIYLIDRVIPMLPETLSNGICSLNPNVDRYVIGLDMEFDKYGNIVKHDLYPATINSKYRLTYDEVDNFENEDKFKKNDELFEMTKNAYELSKIISSKKNDEGYIDFEIVENIIELNEMGRTVSINSKQRLSSEVLIENFMVSANETIAEILNKAKIPSLYRIHESPSDEKYIALQSSLEAIDIKLKVEHSTKPKVFSNFVKKIKEQRFDDFVKIILLRTMQKAKYDINNIGHFGLSSKFYTHFTSPIRRYPDLIVHRIIWEVIFKKNKKYINDLSFKLKDIAKNSSENEEKSVYFERKINDIKKAEFYEGKIGEIKEGVILSIQKFGIFVEFEDNVDALIHINNFQDDTCEVNLEGTKLSCETYSYKLGQKVKVQIIGTSKFEGKIDAVILKD